jgi:hypothetical protein
MEIVVLEQGLIPETPPAAAAAAAVAVAAPVPVAVPAQPPVAPRKAMSQFLAAFLDKYPLTSSNDAQNERLLLSRCERVEDLEPGVSVLLYKPPTRAKKTPVSSGTHFSCDDWKPTSESRREGWIAPDGEKDLDAVHDRIAADTAVVLHIDGGYKILGFRLTNETLTTNNFFRKGYEEQKKHVHIPAFKHSELAKLHRTASVKKMFNAETYNKAAHDQTRVVLNSKGQPRTLPLYDIRKVLAGLGLLPASSGSKPPAAAAAAGAGGTAEKKAASSKRSKSSAGGGGAPGATPASPVMRAAIEERRAIAHLLEHVSTESKNVVVATRVPAIGAVIDTPPDWAGVGPAEWRGRIVGPANGALPLAGSALQLPVWHNFLRLVVEKGDDVVGLLDKLAAMKASERLAVEFTANEMVLLSGADVIMANPVGAMGTALSMGIGPYVACMSDEVAPEIDHLFEDVPRADDTVGRMMQAFVMAYEIHSLKGPTVRRMEAQTAMIPSPSRLHE